jgi:hypothetical protein
MPTESLEQLVRRRKAIRLEIEQLARIEGVPYRESTAEQRRRLHAELDAVNAELSRRGAR